MGDLVDWKFPGQKRGSGGERGIFNRLSLSPTASSIHPVCTAAVHPTAPVRDTAAIDTAAIDTAAIDAAAIDITAIDAAIVTAGTRWIGCVPTHSAVSNS